MPDDNAEAIADRMMALIAQATAALRSGDEAAALLLIQEAHATGLRLAPEDRDAALAKLPKLRP